MFASCNQQSLKLYTGFFTSVKQKFDFLFVCHSHFALQRSSFKLTSLLAATGTFEVVDCDQSSLRFYTGIFIPVKTNSKKSAFCFFDFLCIWRRPGGGHSSAEPSTIAREFGIAGNFPLKFRHAVTALHGSQSTLAVVCQYAMSRAGCQGQFADAAAI